MSNYNLVKIIKLGSFSDVPYLSRFSSTSLQICSLIELVKFVKNYQNVRNEKYKENCFNATRRTPSSNGIEKNQRKLHLKIEKARVASGTA